MKTDWRHMYWNVTSRPLEPASWKNQRVEKLKCCGEAEHSVALPQ